MKISNLKRTLDVFFEQFFLSFPQIIQTNHEDYGYKALLRLDLCLSAFCGKNSFREKHHYLMMQEEIGRISHLYQILGVVWARPDHLKGGKAAVPAASTFCEARQHLKLMSNATIFPAGFQEAFQKRQEKHDFFHIATDGKNVCQTEAGKKSNVVFVHGVCDGIAIFTSKVQAESTWIKEEFPKVMETVMHQVLFKNQEVWFTGDAIYNTPTIWDGLESAKAFGCFPIKGNAPDLLKQAHNRAKRKQILTPIYKISYQRNSKKVTDWVQTFELKCGKSVFRIQRLITENRVDKKETLWFATNHPFIEGVDFTKKIYEIRRKHWSVEIFHQKKDVFLEEDKYKAGKQGGCAAGFLNTNVINLWRQFICKADKFLIEKLQFTFAEMVRAFFLIYFSLFSNEKASKIIELNFIFSKNMHISVCRI